MTGCSNGEELRKARDSLQVEAFKLFYKTGEGLSLENRFARAICMTSDEIFEKALKWDSRLQQLLEAKVAASNQRSRIKQNKRREMQNENYGF